MMGFCPFARERGGLFFFPCQLGRALEEIAICASPLKNRNFLSHVEQSRRSFFLSIIIGCAAAYNCASPLNFFKVIERRLFIDIVSQGKSINIVFLCKIYT
jgi:hypothetical protein